MCNHHKNDNNAENKNQNFALFKIKGWEDGNFEKK